MKKLLYILLFVPLVLFGQCVNEDFFLEIVITFDNYPQEQSILLSSSTEDSLLYFEFSELDETFTWSDCIDSGEYVFSVYDSGGDGSYSSFNLILNGDSIFNAFGAWGASISHTFEWYSVYGCTDYTAFNYNPDANINDESCISLEQHIIDSLEQEINIFENQIDSIQGIKNIYSFEPGSKTAIFYDLNSSSDVVAQFIVNFDTYFELEDNIALITNQKGQFYWPEFAFTNMDALSYGDIIFVETKPGGSFPDFSFVGISDEEVVYENDNQNSNEYMDEEFLNAVALLIPNFQNNLPIDSSIIEEGCMYPLAINYNSQANVDNGACVFDTYIKPYNFSQNRQYFLLHAYFWYMAYEEVQEGDIMGLFKITQSLNNEYLGYKTPYEFEIIGSCFLNEGEDNGFSTSSINFSPSNEDNYQFFVLRDSIFYNAYVSFSGYMTSSNRFVIESIALGEPLIEDGCTNPNSFNYSPIAINDNDLCEDIISIGCLDPTSINYAGESANPTNINALNFGDPFVQNQTYNLLTGELSNSNIAAIYHDEYFCQDDIEGCKEPLALNYDPQANINRETDCIWQLNQMILYNIDETDLISDTLFNFGVFENESDSVINSDFLTANILVENDVLNYNNHIVENMASLMTWIDNNFEQTYSSPIIIDLNEGWNMIGYGCPEPIDLVEGLSNHTESILIVKDNNGDAYLPEWNFNGIGDLIPGFGYQIKVTETIEGFSLCD